MLQNPNPYWMLLFFNYNELCIYYQIAFSNYKYRIWPGIHDQDFGNSKSELWKEIMRQWLIILKKKSIFTGDFSSDFLWCLFIGRKLLKRQVYKEVILQRTEQSPLMTMMWAFKELLKKNLSLWGKINFHRI